MNNKITESKNVILARNKNGEYLIWMNTPIDEITLINGNWIGMSMPGFYNTSMVEDYLGIKFPQMSVSIAPGYKVEIEVIKVVQTSIKRIGEICK